jgi:hypothetical protein
MIDDNALRKFSAFLQASRKALIQCKKDLEHMKRYGRMAYHLDFSLLAPVFFKKTPVDAKQLFVVDREKYIELLKRKDNSSVMLAITGPTLWEFLDFLHHDYRRISSIHRLMLESDGSLDTQIRLLTSDEIMEFLKSNIDTPKSLGPVTRLERLLQEKTLVGIGDVVPSFSHLSLSDFDQELEELVSKQFSERARDNDSRPEKDKRFHYRMDSINALITKAIQRRHQRVCFVTNNRFIRNYCARAGTELIRDPWVPLFVKNLSTDISSGLEYLDEAIDHYEQTVDMIDKGRAHLRIFQQYAHICSSLHTELSSSPFSGESKAEETGDACADKDRPSVEVTRRKLLDALHAEGERLKSEAGGLEKLSKKYDIAYFEQLEIVGDEIIADISRDFGLRKTK